MQLVRATPPRVHSSTVWHNRARACIKSCVTGVRSPEWSGSLESRAPARQNRSAAAVRISPSPVFFTEAEAASSRTRGVCRPLGSAWSIYFKSLTNHLALCTAHYAGHRTVRRAAPLLSAAARTGAQAVVGAERAREARACDIVTRDPGHCRSIRPTCSLSCLASPRRQVSRTWAFLRLHLLLFLASRQRPKETAALSLAA